MRLLLCFCAASLMYAAVVAVAPSIGFVLSDQGRLSRVMGVAGAVIVEPAGQDVFESAAYSGRLLLTLSTGELCAHDGHTASVLDGPRTPNAVFGFSPNGESGAAYSRALSIANVFERGAWRSHRVNLDGEVVAIALPHSDRIAALIARHGLRLVTLRLSDNAIEDDRLIHPAATGPAALLPSGDIVYQLEERVVLLQRSGREHVLDLPPTIASFTVIGSGWLQAASESKVRYAIRTEPDVRVIELPEAPE